jgi:capsular polysaccharide biosynthesis protein
MQRPVDDILNPQTPADLSTGPANDAASTSEPIDSTQEKLIRLIDVDWYLGMNPDVANAGLDPLHHYLNFGGFEGRDPCAYFDSSWYLDRNPDVREQRINPLVHYVTAGAGEGREPNAFFDSAWYMERYADGSDDEPESNALIHFITRGEPCGARPSARFDPKWYLAEYADVAASESTPFAHFLQFGQFENRAPVPNRLVLSALKDLNATLSSLPSSRIPTPADIALPVKAVDDYLRYFARPLVTGSIQPLKSSGDGLPEQYDASRQRPYVAHLESAFVVAGSRYVIVPEGYVLHDEEASRQANDLTKYHQARRLDDGTIRLQFNLRQAAWTQEGINLMHEHSSRYFHFVAEVLPRAILAEEADIPPNTPLLVGSKLHPTMSAMLERVRAPQRSVLQMESGVLYQVADLYQPSDVSWIAGSQLSDGLPTASHLDLGRIRQVVERCRKPLGQVVARRRRRLYLSRIADDRRLLNQQSLEQELVAEGFEILRCDDLGLDTQIRLFSEASIVVSPAGAPLTNIVWCPPDAHVIVLAPDHPSYPLHAWTMLAEVSGVSVEVVRGQRTHHQDSALGMHDDYTVDIAEILDKVQS